MLEPIFKVGQILWKCTGNNEVVSTEVTKVELIEPIYGKYGGYPRTLCISLRFR